MGILLRRFVKFATRSAIVMCGQENKKMSVQATVEELTHVCMENRRLLQVLANGKLKQELALEHIKKYADIGITVNDFQKGLEWFNVSEGLSLRDHLSGKVVVLDFFTYCCINCMHILPDLDVLEKNFTIEDGLVVVGVHSAKFSNERDSTKILSAVQRYNIAHPVVNDAKMTMWRDIGISCWPSLVILGPEGQPLFILVGEGHQEELLLYVKVALSYFKSLDQISNRSLPLKPAQHLLPASKDVLLFPGKIHTFEMKNTEQVIVSDTGNNRILIMDNNGKVEHVIGGYAPAFKDGNFENARFNAPQGICAIDQSIFVADSENHAIRKIDLSTRSVSTVAGIGSQGQDYTGGKLGKDQELSSPWDVAIYRHSQGERTVPVLLIAIAGTHQIWALFLEDTTWWKNKEYKAGTCVAIVGNGREENRNNCYPHAASLAQPSGLAVAQDFDTVYFADSESSTVRSVHLKDGKVSAVCGADKNPSNLHNFGDVDGKQYAAKLQHPLGVAWSRTEGILYVADTYNHKIKKVDPEGNCTTVYGGGKPTNEHTFDEPSGLAITRNGEILYVADTNNHAIKAINLKDGKVSTVSVSLPEETGGATDYTSNFDTAISTSGGDFSFAFDISFKDNLKLNPEAPQRWSLILPSNTWSATSLSGDIKDSINVKIPRGEQRAKLCINFDIVACRSDECIPKRMTVVFNVLRQSDAACKVVEKKQLEIK
ncbi:NHL repeat-containing protein 2 [Orussus abietinus]|uniref:NHL repeat-containing protein 2 n=1 Tax=Orussus abietinus TaxID=222816 RepID=UPI0006254AF4|nr:NHL repeat-containing protein 2 [Orussus abietinus]